MHYNNSFVIYQDNEGRVGTDIMVLSTEDFYNRYLEEHPCRDGIIISRYGISDAQAFQALNFGTIIEGRTLKEISGKLEDFLKQFGESQERGSE